ncbi:HNH endonuclease signature motif containing protein [Streptomyces sp. NPDC047515]|uniref:HNH endonuclease n=1 Tax=Streptomyces sp. NPDC047515 TaxID=3155380 RepID=UPI0033C98DF4
MSFPILWALKMAAGANTHERLILIALAEAARSDGTGAALSKKEIAAVALVDAKTVQRRLGALAERALIAEGDQGVVAHLPEWSRPKVYDLLIPYSAFPDIDQVNADRAARGEAPLGPEVRADLAEAPGRQRRKDFGTVLGPKRQRTGISDALRNFIYERDGYQCTRCGDTDDLTLDHIHPWVLGGANSADNLQTLCRPCNSSKNAKVEDSEVTE